MTTSQLSAKKLLVAGVAVSAALDNNFVAALGTLGLTPATLGNATLADGSVSFPITGGTVTVLDKSSGYRPYVQGTLLHQYGWPEPDGRRHHGRADQLHRGPGHPGAALR